MLSFLQCFCYVRAITSQEKAAFITALGEEDRLTKIPKTILDMIRDLPNKITSAHPLIDICRRSLGGWKFESIANKVSKGNWSSFNADSTLATIYYYNVILRDGDEGLAARIPQSDGSDTESKTISNFLAIRWASPLIGFYYLRYSAGVSDTRTASNMEHEK